MVQRSWKQALVTDLIICIVEILTQKGLSPESAFDHRVLAAILLILA